MSNNIFTIPIDENYTMNDIFLRKITNKFNNNNNTNKIRFTENNLKKNWKSKIKKFIVKSRVKYTKLIIYVSKQEFDNKNQ
jgi:NAD dependent epimerase/dehydratase family enzyme